MKIAITHHSTFDRVRRGTERFVHELGKYLAGRGHQVEVLSCREGARKIRHQDGYLSNAHRRWWFPAMGRVGIHESHSFLASVFFELLTKRYDVIQCCAFTDAIAAQLIGRITDVPVVYFVNAVPPRVKYYRSVTLGGSVFKQAVCGADEVIAISEYVRDYCQNRFGRGGVCLPVPVDTELFNVGYKQPTTKPILVCTAALDDRRKGGRVLMQAFNLAKQQIPELELEVCCKLSDDDLEGLQALVEPQYRNDVRFLGAGQASDLPKVYGRATASVLPSIWEAFGLVVIESLAVGTPVVVTRDGALPENIHEGVGRLFDRGGNGDLPEAINYQGLAQAIVETIALGQQEETIQRCRMHAEQFGWDVVGRQYEALYERVIAERQAQKLAKYEK